MNIDKERDELLRLAQFLKDRQSCLGSSKDYCFPDELSAWDDYEKAWTALERFAALDGQKAGPSDAIAELVPLLRAIRPNYGAVGSRDVDVADQQQRIDRAIALLSLYAAPQASAEVRNAALEEAGRTLDRLHDENRQYHTVFRHASNTVRALKSAPASESPAKGAKKVELPSKGEPVADCYSDNHGESWRDCPDDIDFVNGLEVGDEYELQASVQSWTERFRVTKAPDDVSDEYEVEPVSIRVAAPVNEQDAKDAQRLNYIEHNLTIWDGSKHVKATRENIDVAIAQQGKGE